mmetsp:Transcript_82505/g.212563  ORF Transcript_82505/g.212563 Transcript_82505/m.212563 type:complete len:429 (+) Transcript_82505:151-1437(+)
MPQAAHADAVVRLQHPVVLLLLEVPEPDLAVDVAGHHPLAVGREPRGDGIACVQMALPLLLAHKLELAEGLVADDLVVHRLPDDVRSLLVRPAHDHGRDRVHGGLRDVLHHHRDAVLPEEDLLVVGGGEDALALFAERHRVHGAEVLVVLLHDGLGIRVPLHRLLVRAPADDDILLRRIGVNSDAERSLLVGEGRNDLAGLSVPILDVLVVGDTVELAAIAGEVDVAHSLVVTQVCPEALPLVVVVPDHDLRVHAGREQQVGRVREEADLLHAHRVTLPRVDPLLRQEALLVVHILGDLDLVLDPRAPSVVRLLGSVEDGRDALLGLALLALYRLLLLALTRDLLLAHLDLRVHLLPDRALIHEAAPLGATLGLHHLVAAWHGPRVLGVLGAEAPPLEGLVPDGLAVLWLLRLGARQRLVAPRVARRV